MSVPTRIGRTLQAPRRFVERTGLRLARLGRLFRDLAAFAVIILGVSVSKFNVSRRIMWPLVFEQIWKAGVRELPLIGLLGAALGLVIVGQTITLLTRVGAEGYIGTVMVSVVIRELGPLLTALLVLARAGTANVVELGTVRALGEVEALESLGIDPIHYLVMPRVLGLATAVFCLTTYLILITIGCGWLFTFMQDIPLRLTLYLQQLGDALRWQDFVFLALKTLLFGAVIAVVNCYHGLARPLHMEDISRVTARAVVETVTACIVIDAVFLVGYLLI